MKKHVTFFLILCGMLALGLTPQERQFAERARHYIEAAKEKAVHEQQIQENQLQRINETESTVKEQSQELGVLSKQVEDKQKEAEGLAKYNAYAKPIIEQVNSHWGLGAFVYGFNVLAKHVLIMLAVLFAIGLAIFILSATVAPWLAPMVQAFGEFVGWFFRKIASFFKKGSK